LEITK